MSEITVGELLVRCLKAEGIELIAGIIDGAHIPIVVHTEKYGIRYVNVHHEEAAVHVAEGYSRIARKPGVGIGNPACGTGNMLAGVVSAHGEGHPIVAIGLGGWGVACCCPLLGPLLGLPLTVLDWLTGCFSCQN